MTVAIDEYKSIASDMCMLVGSHSNTIFILGELNSYIVDLS